jgi:hypothetical protein
MFSKQLLVLANPATPNYQGTYQCKASNDDGTLLGPKINVYFSSTCVNKSDERFFDENFE